MPNVGELQTAKMPQELRNAAVVGSARAISFACPAKLSTQVPQLPKSLPRAASRQLEEIERTQYYRNRGILFHQGERLTGVHILRRGTVKLSMTSSKGRAVILRIAEPGEILGLASVLSGEPCIATAEALEDCEIGYVEREQFLSLLLHNPEAALSIACHACANYQAVCRRVSLLALCRSASERMAQFLLDWAYPRICRGAAPVPLRLTHEEISQLAGTTRETVTRTLIDFRKRGWASVAASNLLIQDREALEKLVA